MTAEQIAETVRDQGPQAITDIGINTLAEAVLTRPALLEALKNYMAGHRCSDATGEQCPSLDAARVAIALATPEEEVRCCANDSDVIEAGNHCTCPRCTEDE